LSIAQPIARSKLECVLAANELSRRFRASPRARFCMWLLRLPTVQQTTERESSSELRGGLRPMAPDDPMSMRERRDRERLRSLGLCPRPDAIFVDGAEPGLFGEHATYVTVQRCAMLCMYRCCAVHADEAVCMYLLDQLLGDSCIMYGTLDLRLVCLVLLVRGLMAKLLLN